MKQINEGQFDNVLAAAKEKWVLVDFYATWCAPCKVLSPILSQLEKEYGDKVEFIKVDVDENRRLATAFQIRSMPTVVILKPKSEGPGADVVYSAVGVQSYDRWQQALERLLTPKKSLFSKVKSLF